MNVNELHFQMHFIYMLNPHLQCIQNKADFRMAYSYYLFHIWQKMCNMLVYDSTLSLLTPQTHRGSLLLSLSESQSSPPPPAVGRWCCSAPAAAPTPPAGPASGCPTEPKTHTIYQTTGTHSCTCQQGPSHDSDLISRVKLSVSHGEQWRLLRSCGGAITHPNARVMSQ